MLESVFSPVRCDVCHEADLLNLTKVRFIFIFVSFTVSLTRIGYICNNTRTSR